MPFPQESPIDLHDPIYAQLGDRALKIHWSGPVHGLVAKDADGVRVDTVPDQDHFIVLDRKQFHLIGFHFHHPSEHWVDGKQRTMELHLVHKSIHDETLAVIGVFLEVAAKPTVKPALLTFLQQVAAILAQPSTPELDTRVSVNPDCFLPRARNKYYWYEGSLTTHEFNETVSWVVMRDPLLMKPNDLKKLIGQFIKPARFPQPLHRRFVLVTFRP